MPRFDSTRTLGNRKFAETFWNSRLIYLFQFSTHLQSLKQSNKQKILDKSKHKWILVWKLKSSSKGIPQVFLAEVYLFINVKIFLDKFIGIMNINYRLLGSFSDRSVPHQLFLCWSDYVMTPNFLAVNYHSSIISVIRAQWGISGSQMCDGDTAHCYKWHGEIYK